MHERSSKSPWVSIWTQPRETIRHIVDTNPRRSFYWLAAIYALQSILFLANYLSLGLTYHYLLIFLIAILLSPALGTIWIYIYAWLFRMSGKWLGGKAPASHVRAAFAWSKVPLLINLAMWFILLMFSTDYVFIQYSSGPSLFFINVITLISGIWSFVILVQCFREIQEFSLGRSIGNVLLGYALGFILFFLISFIITSLIGMTSKS